MLQRYLPYTWQLRDRAHYTDGLHAKPFELGVENMGRLCKC
jgi:hypothetical protein